MLCLLITSKFDYLAHATELSIKNASNNKSYSHSIPFVEPATEKWMNPGDITGVCIC